MLTPIALLLLTLSQLTTDIPPIPDFKTRIDYFAWIEQAETNGLPASDNATELYQSILGETGSDHPLGFEGFYTTSEKPPTPAPWDPEKEEAWERAFQATRPARETFRKAAAMPYYWPGIRFEPGYQGPKYLAMNWVMTDLQKLRGFTRGVAENAWRASSGRISPADFVADYRALLGCAQQLEASRYTIRYCTGLMTRQLAYAGISEALRQNVLAPSGNMELLKMLKADDRPIFPFRRVQAFEMASALDVIQMIALDSRGAYSLNDQSGFTLGGSKRINPKRTRNTVIELTTAIIRLADAPYAADTKYRMNQIVEEATQKDELLKLMLPFITQVYVIRTQADASRRATRLLIELHVYRDLHGKWPASLDELPSDLPAEFKVAPFSNQPFHYSVSGDEMRLYSFAQNGVDDRGAHDPQWGNKGEQVDYVFWPVQLAE